MGRMSEILKTGAILTTFGVAISYYFVMAHAGEIRKNWSARKCDPRVMPFAGIINPPETGSASEFTASNFAECLSETGKYIASDAVAPAHYLVAGIDDSVSELSSAVNASRNVVNSIRSSMESVANEVSSRALNTALPLVGTSYTMKAGLHKAQAVGGTALFATEGLLLSSSAVIGAFIEFLIIIAGIYVATASLLISIPFCLGCPVGLPLLALGLAVLAFIVVVMVIVVPHIPTSGL